MNRQIWCEIWFDLTAESHKLHSTTAPVKEIKACMQQAQCHGQSSLYSFWRGVKAMEMAFR